MFPVECTPVTPCVSKVNAKLIVEGGEEGRLVGEMPFPPPSESPDVTTMAFRFRSPGANFILVELSAVHVITFALVPPTRDWREETPGTEAPPAAYMVIETLAVTGELDTIQDETAIRSMLVARVSDPLSCSFWRGPLGPSKAEVATRAGDRYL